MNQLVEKLASMEREVADERGGFRLFSLFLREDSPNKWDLLVSAPWLDADQSEGMAYLAKRVRSCLDTQELLSLSRIVPIAADNPGLAAIAQAFHVVHSQIELRDRNLFGLQIKHAYIVTCDMSSTSQQNALPA